MNEYNTYKLEKYIHDIIYDLFSSQWTYIFEDPYVYIRQQDVVLRILFTEDKFIYHLNIKGKTKILRFIIVFHVFENCSLLYLCTRDRFIRLTDKFNQETIDLLVPVTNNIRIKL